MRIYICLTDILVTKKVFRFSPLFDVGRRQWMVTWVAPKPYSRKLASWAVQRG